MSPDFSAFVYLSLVALVLLILVALLGGLVPRGGYGFRTTASREQGLLLTVLPVGFVFIGLLGRNLSFAGFLAVCLVVFGLQAFGPKRWRRGRVWGAGPFPLKIKSWEQIDDRTTLVLSLGYRLVVLDKPANRPFLDALAAEP